MLYDYDTKLFIHQAIFAYDFTYGTNAFCNYTENTKYIVQYLYYYFVISAFTIVKLEKSFGLFYNYNWYNFHPFPYPSGSYLIPFDCEAYLQIKVPKHKIIERLLAVLPNFGSPNGLEQIVQTCCLEFETQDI